MFICAHDCGQIINPDGVRAQVEGSILQTVSRVLMEEVKFDRSRVSSVDWASYPILRFSEAPKIEIDLVDRPTEPPLGAGEAACAAVGAALANAVYDASGRAAAHRSVHAGAREGGVGRPVELKTNRVGVIARKSGRIIPCRFSNRRPSVRQVIEFYWIFPSLKGPP